MNTNADKKEENKRQSAATKPTQKKSSSTSAFQFVDNRPEAVTQRKLNEIINNSTQEKQQQLSSEATKNVTQFKTTGESVTNKVIQLGKKRKKKEEDSDDEDGAWVPVSERRKHRQTFSQKLRNTVIKKARRIKSGLYVCPGCGMPLADRKGKEIKTFYISKSKKRHNIVSGQLDHYPKWSGRLKALKRLGKSDSAIRKDHDDPNRLRPLCLRCNGSHKFEKTKKLPEDGFSDEEYYSDDEARDKEIWKKYRKDDKDPPPGGSSLMT